MRVIKSVQIEGGLFIDLGNIAQFDLTRDEASRLRNRIDSFLNPPPDVPPHGKSLGDRLICGCGYKCMGHSANPGKRTVGLDRDI